MARPGLHIETSQLIKPSHLWYLALMAVSVLLAPILLMPSPYNILPFVALGGGLFVFAAFRQPFVGLFVYLFIFFFRPYEMFPVPVPYEKIVAIVVLIILAFHLVVGRVKVRFDRLDWTVVGFVAAAAASVISFTDMGDNTQSFFAFFEFFKIFLVFFFTVQIANSKSKLEAIVWLFVLSNLYLAATTTVNYHLGNFRYSMGIARARGFADDGLFSHPNSIASSVVLGLPFLYYMFLHYRNLVVRGLLVGLALLGVWTVIITGSRGGMMALFAFIVIIGWRSRYRGLALGASLIGILLVIAVMPEQYQDRLFSLANMFGEDTSGAAESARGRLEGIVVGLRLFLMRPLTGVGIGVFGRAHYIVDGIPTDAHSLIGQLVGELGLVGLVAFIWFVTVKVRYMKSLIDEYHSRRWSPDILYRITQALQAALILLFVQGFSGHNLFRYNWYIFAGFVSIMTFIAADRIAQEQPAPDTPDPENIHASKQSNVSDG